MRSPAERINIYKIIGKTYGKKQNAEQIRLLGMRRGNARLARKMSVLRNFRLDNRRTYRNRNAKRQKTDAKKLRTPRETRRRGGGKDRKNKFGRGRTRHRARRRNSTVVARTSRRRPRHRQIDPYDAGCVYPFEKIQSALRFGGREPRTGKNEMRKAERRFFGTYGDKRNLARQYFGLRRRIRLFNRGLHSGGLPRRNEFFGGQRGAD